MSSLTNVTADNKSNDNLLNRSLGLGTSILLVAGLMIGSGAFKKIAPMSQQLGNSTYIILAWITAGIISMFGAFTYAGLATLTNKTGGIFEYLRLSFGDFISFLFGWSRNHASASARKEERVLDVLDTDAILSKNDSNHIEPEGVAGLLKPRHPDLRRPAELALLAPVDRAHGSAEIRRRAGLHLVPPPLGRAPRLRSPACAASPGRAGRRAG